MHEYVANTSLKCGIYDEAPDTQLILLRNYSLEFVTPQRWKMCPNKPLLSN